MSHHDHPFRRPPAFRPADGRHRRLRDRLPDRFAGGLRHRPLHAAGLAGLRDAGDEVPRLRQAPGPAGPGRRHGRGVPVPGTSLELDPVQAAFNIGAQVRWLDFNDTWLAAEWGHPSDNLGAILAVGDYLSRAQARARPAHRARRARLRHQGARDPGRLCAAELLQPGGPGPRDPGPPGLHRGRHRACWAAARRRSSTRSRTAGSTTACCAPTATRPTPGRARAGRPATPAGARSPMRSTRSNGEVGYPSALSVPTWGFYDVAFKRQAVPVRAPLRQLRDGERAVQDQLPGRVPRPDRGRVRDALHPQVRDRLDQIERIVIETRRPASASSTRPARWPTTPTATTACSTWWPCR
jgi:2-methylcitrate dehydratase